MHYWGFLQEFQSSPKWKPNEGKPKRFHKMRALHRLIFRKQRILLHISHSWWSRNQHHLTCFHPVKEPSSGQNTFKWVSKFKFSIQNVTRVHIASPSSRIPTTRTLLVTHVPFRINTKRGERKRDLDLHQKTSWGTNTSTQQAGWGFAQGSASTVTYPRTERCQAQRWHWRRHQGRSAWLCWLLPWPRAPLLLPSGYLGRSCSRWSLLFPCCCCVSASTVHKLCPWALLLLLLSPI